MKHITREDLIAMKLLFPTPKEYAYWDRPEMTFEIVEGYRQRLIKAGLLTPKNKKVN